MFTKKIKIIIISLSVVVIILILGSYIASYIGHLYIKGSEGKRTYEFIEDMNADGKKENVRFVNKYCSYYKKNVSDAEYTSNYIKIYIDDKKIYSNTINTLNPLINPQIIEIVESNNKKKQIYLHDDGGGSAVPRDFFFSMEDDNFALSEKESSY